MLKRDHLNPINQMENVPLSLQMATVMKEKSKTGSFKEMEYTAMQ
jgi:hypothetical protein